jgi:hypothetical protein
MLTTAMLTALVGILRLLTGLLRSTALLLAGLLVAALMLLSALIRIIRHVVPFESGIMPLGQRSGSQHVPISFCFYLVFVPQMMNLEARA